MKVLQLFYTSCETGISLRSGFQTYSMSEGITEPERYEIERYGVYIPPHHLPSQPSTEEIKTHFPTALTFFQLSSGRYGVCQTKYVGQDYSGRYGNYFCHALIFEKGQAPFYPIQLWESEIFQSQLPDLPINEIPSPLPTLEVSELQQHLNPNLHASQIAQFLSHENRDTIFPKLLTAIIDYEKSQRRLMLCDKDNNIPYWIAALTMVFPIRLAHTLLFTTYTYNPEEQDLLLCSTPSIGTSFAFSEMQRNFSYYIFDFIGHKSSQLENHYEFSQYLNPQPPLSPSPPSVLPMFRQAQQPGEEAGQGSPEFEKRGLEGISFHDFLDLFNYHKINSEIESAYHLFRLCDSPVDEIDFDKIKAAIDFAQTYAPNDILAQLFEKIVPRLNTLADIETAEMVTGFLLKVARNTKNPLYLETTYHFFLTTLDHLIIEKGITIHQALKFYETISTLDGEMQALIALSIKPERLNKLATNVLPKKPQLAEIYFKITLNNLIAAGYTWEQCIADTHFQTFLQAGFNSLFKSKKSLCEALRIQNHKFFAQLMTQAITQAAFQNHLIEILLDYLITEVPETYASAIRLRLLASEQKDFVFKEFIKRLAATKNKPHFFEHYQNTIFSKHPEFAKHYFSPAVKAYLECLSVEQRTLEYSKLLSQASLLNDEVLTHLITKIEKQFPLSPPNTNLKQQILSLSKIKKARNITTSPDITGLVVFAMKLKTSSKLISLPQLFLKKPYFEGIDSKRYQEYLTWILPMLFELKLTIKDHGILLNSLNVSGISFERKLLGQYIALITQTAKREKDDYKVVINFMVYYLVLMPKEKNPGMTLLHRLFWGDVVNMLTRLPKSYLKEIEIALSQQAGNYEGIKMFKILQQEIKHEQKIFLPAIDFLKTVFKKYQS